MTLVLGLLASGILLVYVSIALSVLAAPAVIVLILGVIQRIVDRKRMLR